MDNDYKIAESIGLKVARIDVCASAVPLEASPDIRICVPLGSGHSFLAACGAPGAHHETEVSAPEIWIVPPRHGCTLTCYGRVRLVVMWLSAEFFEREAIAVTGTPAPVVDDFVAVDPVIGRLARVLSAGFRVGRPPDVAYLSMLAHQLAAHVARTYGRASVGTRAQGLSQERLDRVLRLIDERITDSLLVEELAEAAHMSAFHFARMFKRSTGHSPHFYITMRRVERAKQLLSETEMPLAEISATLGYATQAHFTGVFREHAGATPRTYRTRFGRKLGRVGLGR